MHEALLIIQLKCRSEASHKALPFMVVLGGWITGRRQIGPVFLALSPVRNV